MNSPGGAALGDSLPSRRWKRLFAIEMGIQGCPPARQSPTSKANMQMRSQKKKNQKRFNNNQTDRVCAYLKPLWICPLSAHAYLNGTVKARRILRVVNLQSHVIGKLACLQTVDLADLGGRYRRQCSKATSSRWVQSKGLRMWIPRLSQWTTLSWKCAPLCLSNDESLARSTTSSTFGKVGPKTHGTLPLSFD